MTSWDRFYGANSPETVRAYQGTLDQARFTLGDGKRRVDYVSYPAEAPINVAVEFQRSTAQP